MSNGCWERARPRTESRTNSGYLVRRIQQSETASAPASPTGHRRYAYSRDSRYTSGLNRASSVPPKSRDLYTYPEPVRITSGDHRDVKVVSDNTRRHIAVHSQSHIDKLGRQDSSYSTSASASRHVPSPVVPKGAVRPPTSKQCLTSSNQDELLNILVVGGTGVGKSELVSQLADPSRSRETARVGHTLMSCTSEVTSFPCICDGVPFNLIDSPGFDDTRYSDAEILAKFAQFFRQRSTPPIHGVIFMHRISDTRLSGSAVQTAQIIKDMCGVDFKDRIVLVTTMWDRVRDKRISLQREKELLHHPRFWRDLYDDDEDRTFRFGLSSSEGSSKAARGIVRFFLDDREELLSRPVPLQFARETRRGEALESTAAGASLMRQNSRRQSSTVAMKDGYPRQTDYRQTRPEICVR